MRTLTRSFSDIFEPSRPTSRASENKLAGDDFIKQKGPDESAEHGDRRRQVEAALEHGVTEVFMGCVIFVNFVVICIETDAEAADAPALPWAELVGFACFVVYVVEWFLHAYVQRLHVFLSASADFDLVIILFGAMEYILGLTGGSNSSGMLRLLRLLRLLRVIKLFRALKDLRTLLQMLASCVRTLMWSFFLCFMVLTIWSVAAVQVLNDIVQEIDAEFGFPDCERCGRAFASVMASNLTFAQIILAGDAWGVLAIPTIEHSPHTIIFFVGVLVTLMFGILNLVVAAVVDTFAETRRNNVNMIANDLELSEQEEKAELQTIFHEIDNDGDGDVSFHDVVQGAEQASGMRNWLRALDIGKADLRELFDIMDENQNGHVSASEFAAALYRLKHSETKITAKMSKIILQNVEMKADAIMKGLQQLMINQSRQSDLFSKASSSRTDRPPEEAAKLARGKSFPCSSSSHLQMFPDSSEHGEGNLDDTISVQIEESALQFERTIDEGSLNLKLNACATSSLDTDCLHSGGSAVQTPRKHDEGKPIQKRI
eukprot:TRINITY_DN9931_c0_g2_i1.p1 TRINITY_DN9931_c0_g2~~TRINITY_DN9931_c0_g2_i1.p1  ORF type:complete len:544 (+),score=92.69 TRINITY_DN9931_c0_g2_i1:116-1747(+)